jgi:hypothetical protein
MLQAGGGKNARCVVRQCWIFGSVEILPLALDTNYDPPPEPAEDERTCLTAPLRNPISN